MAPTTSKFYTHVHTPCIIRFQFYSKELLNKLLTVMGINTEILYRRPDKSYVLTADNTKKILAILMRFRYYCIILYRSNIMSHSLASLP